MGMTAWQEEVVAAARDRSKKRLEALAESSLCSGPGATPLMACCFDGNVECVKLVAKLYPDGWSDRARSGETALICAVQGGNEECVELAATYSDVEGRDMSGWSALSWAVAEGRVEVVEALVRRGAPRDWEGLDVDLLLFACLGNNRECVERVLSLTREDGLSPRGCLDVARRALDDPENFMPQGMRRAVEKWAAGKEGEELAQCVDAKVRDGKAVRI